MIGDAVTKVDADAISHVSEDKWSDVLSVNLKNFVFRSIYAEIRRASLAHLLHECQVVTPAVRAVKTL